MISVPKVFFGEHRLLHPHMGLARGNDFNFGVFRKCTGLNSRIYGKSNKN